MKNYGVIIEHRETDYIFGAATKIIHEDRNTTGDWTQFLPSDERQAGRKTDSMGCVTFSAMNSLECQLKWMLDNNLLAPSTLKFLNDNGYMVGGRPNLSDRFIAKMSGTTPQGNSLQAVWDAIRKYGCVPEILWPDNLEDFDWAQFYADIPQNIKDIGKEWLTHFSSAYELLSLSDIPKALKHAPIQIATAVCQPWSAPNPVPACDLAVAHATMIYCVEKGGVKDIFDSYDPFRKRLAPDYKLPFLLKGILTPLIAVSTNQPDPSKEPFLFKRDLVAGERSEDVRQLQSRLGVLSTPTTFYGPLTVAAVKRYMVFNQIGSWWEQYVWPSGKRVGPKIRHVLNANSKT